MGSPLGTIGLAAIGLYALVLGACLLAAQAASAGARALPGGRQGDARHWLAAAAVFAFLAGFRLLEGEEAIRQGARGAIAALGAYSARRGVQAPLAAGALVLGAGCVWLFARRWRLTRPGSRARPVLLARFGLLALLPLYGLRLISLHQTDRLLYAGPLRLNWLLEGAVCLCVGGAALVYARTVRRQRRFAARHSARG